MPKSRSLTIPASAEDPVAIHVYGPALRRNPDHEDDPIPVWAVHFPKSSYREFILVDRIHGNVDGRYFPDKPLPAGIGGNVVAYMLVRESFGIETFDPWNWEARHHGPPRIMIGADLTKVELYKAVVQKYSRRNRG